MTELSTALRLADAIDPLTRDWLDNLTCGAAAAELRRLHKEIGDWDRVCNQHLKHIDKLKKRMKKAEAVNKELLKAMENIERSTHDVMTATLARAAIARAEGKV